MRQAPGERERLRHAIVTHSAYSSAPLFFEPRIIQGDRAMRSRRRIVVAGTLAVALAIMAGGLVGCGGAQSRLASHMDHGRAYFDQGNFAKAQIEFRNALQIKPDDPEASYMAGRTAEKLGRVREALGYYQGAVDHKPDDPRPRASLARILLFAGQADRALTLLTAGLAKAPDDANLLAVRGAVYLVQKKNTDALADAQRAARLAPTNEDAIALLAGIYTRTGDTTRAAEVINAALTKSPKSTALRQMLVSVYVSAHDPASAEAQVRKLIELNPEDFAYRRQLALYLVSLNKVDEAQKELENAVAAIPKSNDPKLALADFLTVKRTRADGEKLLRTYIAHDPDNLDLRIGLGTLLQRAGALPEAKATFQEALDRDSGGAKSLAVRNRIAAIEMDQGNYDAAAKLVAAVLEKNPRDADALTLRGGIELRKNDATAAIEDFRGVLHDQPGLIPVQMKLAQAYVANGNNTLAEETLKAVKDAAPANTTARLQLAQLLIQDKRADDAVKMLEDGVRASPSDGQLREGLLRAYLAKGDFAAARSGAEDLKTLLPKSAAGFFFAAMADQGANKLDAAEKDYEDALQMQPGAIDALTALARLQLLRGHGTQAIARVRKVVDASPDNPLALNLLGELCLTTKDFPQATEAFTRATRAAPQWSMPYRGLALIKVAAHDNAGAEAAYENAIKIAPNEPQLVVELASLYERDHRVDDAIARYEDLYKRNPHMQVAANNLAVLLVNYKSDQRSLDRARDLTSAFGASQNGSLLDTNGWVRFKRKEYTEALQVLERAAERAPDSKEIRYHVGMAELQAGQRDRARTHLEEALSGTGSFTGSDDARAALASLKSQAG